jgi:hypothetical protein
MADCTQPLDEEPQKLPSAWRAGEVALLIEADEDYSGMGFANHIVRGTLRGQVTLEAFRLFRRRRAWYVSGTLPTPTGGALVYEDDLRQLDGSPKVDEPFRVFLQRALSAPAEAARKQRAPRGRKAGRG